MLTTTLARDYIFRVPRCQMERLTYASWTCGNPDGDHQHSVFGNHIVRNNLRAERTESDCPTSLMSVLLDEANYKEIIKDEEWSCFEPKLDKCNLHYGDYCKECRMDKTGRYLAVVEGWLNLAATQCSAPKDLKAEFVETPIEDIIVTILSPHSRAYCGLVFPQSWDPLRPLNIRGSKNKKLEDTYGVPVACECNYDIPLLKSVPKPKKVKKGKTTDTKIDKKDTKIDKKVKDANKNVKASTSKGVGSAESSIKTTKTKESQVNKNEKGSDTKDEEKMDVGILDAPDDPPDPNLMDVSEGANSANGQPNLSSINIDTGDTKDSPLDKTTGDTSVPEVDKTSGTTAGASTEALPDSDTNSVGGDSIMSEQPEQVELDAPLHDFTADEDKSLLQACWDPNLSPRWTSSVHLSLGNSKELLLLNWLCRGFESGYWHNGVPDDCWVPQEYKLLPISDVYALKARVVGSLARSSVFKHPSKTHDFYLEREKAHRAAQESKERHVICVSAEQLFTLVVQITKERERQASNGAMGLDTVLTPWISHKIRDFVGNNLVHPVTGNQKSSNDCQWEQVNRTVGGKRRGSNASSKGRGNAASATTRGGSNALTPSVGLNGNAPEGNTADTDGDDLGPTPGGSNPSSRGGRNWRGGRGGANKKRDRSSSSVRTEEQVPAKRGGGAGRGGRGSNLDIPVEYPKNPRDCQDRSKVWPCPLTNCSRHVNYIWQRTCFACKTYFVQDRGGNWVPSAKPSGQSGGQGFSRGTRRGNRTRG